MSCSASGFSISAPSTACSASMECGGTIRSVLIAASPRASCPFPPPTHAGLPRFAIPACRRTRQTDRSRRNNGWPRPPCPCHLPACACAPSARPARYACSLPTPVHHAIQPVAHRGQPPLAVLVHEPDLFPVTGHRVAEGRAPVLVALVAGQVLVGKRAERQRHPAIGDAGLAGELARRVIRADQLGVFRLAGNPLAEREFALSRLPLFRFGGRGGCFRCVPCFFCRSVFLVCGRFPDFSVHRHVGNPYCR